MTDTPTVPKLQATGPVRMRYDLIEKLDAITWSMGFQNNADGIDAILREEIERLFGDLAPAIQQRALGRIARFEADNA